MTDGSTETQLLNLNVYGAAVYFPMAGRAMFTLQASLLLGSWGSAVVTVTRSNDKATWTALETVTTFSADGSTTQREACFEWMRCQVTTAAGGAGVANFSTHAMRDA